MGEGRGGGAGGRALRAASLGLAGGSRVAGASPPTTLCGRRSPADSDGGA